MKLDSIVFILILFTIYYQVVFLIHALTRINREEDRLFVNPKPFTYYTCMERLYSFQKLFGKKFKSLANVIGNCNTTAIKSKRKYSYFSYGIERAFRTEIPKDFESPRKVAWDMMDLPMKLLVICNLLIPILFTIVSIYEAFNVKDVGLALVLFFISLIMLPLFFLVSMVLQGMIFQVIELFLQAIKVDRYYFS